MLYRYSLIFVLFNLSLFGEALPQQPKDYYVEMASLNLLTYGVAYRLEPDPVGKLSLAANMAFISFNYLVQKEKGVIRWSAAYEKAIKIGSEFFSVKTLKWIGAG